MRIFKRLAHGEIYNSHFAYSQVILDCDVVCKIMGIVGQAPKFKASCGLSLSCVHLGQFYKPFCPQNVYF